MYLHQIIRAGSSTAAKCRGGMGITTIPGASVSAGSLLTDAEVKRSQAASKSKWNAINLTPQLTFRVRLVLQCVIFPPF